MVWQLVLTIILYWHVLQMEFQHHFVMLRIQWAIIVVNHNHYHVLVQVDVRIQVDVDQILLDIVVMGFFNHEKNVM